VKNRFCGTCFFAVVVMLLAAICRAAIDRGTIQGTVTDAQTASIPKVRVEITNTATGVTATQFTNDSGFYAASELVPGSYTVRFQSKGFATLEFTNIEVKAGTTATVDGVLKVGQLAETVDVRAEAPLVEQTASNFSTEVQGQILDQVPIVGRDIQTLVQLLPGVTQSVGPSGSVFGFNSQFGGFPDPTHIVGSGISVNGSQGGANAWYLDGTLNAIVGPESVVVNPAPDAVSEFAMLDNGLAAEWSRTSGAVISVVLKSGTNQFHGNAYGFNRNSYFSASNPFQRRDAAGSEFLSPAVNFNDFGGTIGGPIRKNKTFFFASWETSFLHELQPRLYTVPTAQERQGNFTDRPDLAANCDPAAGVNNCLYDPTSTTGPDANGLFHRTPFATPIIPKSRIDPLAAYYVNSFPNPNFVDPLQQGPSGCGVLCNNFLGDVGSSQTTHNLSVKVDHQIRDNSKLFVEYLLNPSWYTNYRLPWTGPTAQTAGVAGAQPYRTFNQIFTLGHTQTFGGSFVNEARASYSRQNQKATPNPNALVDNNVIEEKVKGLNFISDPTFFPVPTIGLGSGLPSFGPQQWQNAIQGEDAYTVLDNVTKIIGKHTLKAGVMWRRDDNWNLAGWGYNLSFGGTLTNDPVTGLGGNALAQFLLGAVDQGSGTGTYHAPYQTNDYWGFYLQDDFRITKNFTLNIGLRYDLFGWFRERTNALANFDFNIQNPDVPYTGGLVYFGTPAHPASNVFPANKNSLGPRINFSWAPSADRKTVIRGGYDIIYSNSISSAFGDQNGAISAPAYANYFTYGQEGTDHTGERPAFILSQGAPNLNLPPLGLVKTTNNQFLGTSVGSFLQGDHDPYVEQWSLYVQRELPSNMVLSVGYVGTHGLHLYGDEFRNYDHIPTAVRLQDKTQINQTVATPPGLVSLYGPTVPLSLISVPYPQYAGVGVNVSPDGFNRYNSLQTKFEKRYSQGMTFTAVYSFSKNIISPNFGSIIGNTATPTTLGRTVGRAAFIPGAISGGSGNVAGSAGAQNPDDRDLDVAVAPDDIPNILNLAIVYELPFGKGKSFFANNKAGRAVLGGWRLTQNWNFQSGVPVTITGPCDAISCRPDLVGNPQQFSGPRTRQDQENQWFNPAAFLPAWGSNPAIATSSDPTSFADFWNFGTMGVRSPLVRAPGFWNTDMSLSREFHLSEVKYLTFRWEVYNALNHQNLGIPNLNYCLPPNADGSTDLLHQFGCQFGKITNVQTDPRAMQFGLKFNW